MKYRIKFDNRLCNFAFAVMTGTGFFLACTILATNTVLDASDAGYGLVMNLFNLVVYFVLVMITCAGVYGTVTTIIESIIVETEE